MKLTSLKDLQQVQRHLAEAQARAAAQDAARREAERRLQAERDLFTRAVGAVKALPDARKAQLKLPPPAPVAVQQQRDDQAVLREAISDEFDVGTLLEADEQLSFRRPGIGPDVTRKPAPRRMEHPARAGPARPAHRRRARSAGHLHPRGGQDGPALRARGAWQGPGLTGQGAGAEIKGARLADPEDRGAGLRTGQARGRRRRGPAGAAAGLGQRDTEQKPLNPVVEWSSGAIVLDVVSALTAGNHLRKQ
jgi:hypothetical protein